MLAAFVALSLLSPPSIVSGTFMDGLQHPAAQVLVQIEDRTGAVVWVGTTDDQGHFFGEVPWNAFPCRLDYRTPEGDTHGSQKVPIARDNLVVKLKSVRVRLFVYDDAGQPAPDAEVVGFLMKRAAKTVNLAGKQAPAQDSKPIREPFRLTPGSAFYVDKGFLQSIRCVASRGEMATKEPVKPSASGDVALTLSKHAWSSFGLDFIDQDGNPMKVNAPTLVGEVSGASELHVAKDSSYEYKHVYPGQELGVEVRLEGYTAGDAAFGRIADLTIPKLKAGSKVARTVQLYPNTDEVGGVVVDSSGKPKAGVLVFSDYPMMYQSWEVICSVTDAKGHFLLKQIPRKSLQLLLYPDRQHAFASDGGKLVSVEGGKLDNKVVF